MEKKNDIVISVLTTIGVIVSSFVFGLMMREKEKGVHIHLTPAQPKYTTIKLEDSDILVIWLKYELPETESNLITYSDADSVKYSADVLIVEHLTDGFIQYNTNEIIAWGIDR